MWWVIVEIFWLVVVGGEYILAGGGCWWVVVDIFWMLVDGGIFWLVVGGGGSLWVVAWFSLTHINFMCQEIKKYILICKNENLNLSKC